MTETEYIRATNMAKMSITLTTAKDILAGDDYGITDAKLAEIILRLTRARDELFGLCGCKED